MNRKDQQAVPYDLRQAFLTRHWMLKQHFALTRSMALWLLAVAIFAGWAAPRVNAQSNVPGTVEADVPFEMRVPWFNREHTAVEDEVTLRGTLYIVNKVWMSSTTHVDRITIHVNAVDIHGTSETTGQRFRLNGSSSVDLRNPDVTFNADGTINLPPAQYKLFLHKVDPEPARLDSLPFGGSGTTTPASYWNTNPTPLPPRQCSRVYLADGTPTGWVDCGGFRWSSWLTPIVYLDRVYASGGAACPSTGLCQVPNGATLFNGFAGDYNPPLLMKALSWTERSGTAKFEWHCKTGNLDAAVVSEGGFSRCTPVYSATDPVIVYANVIYRIYMYEYTRYALQTITVPTAPHVFHYLDRPNQPPVIEAFSVKTTIGSGCLDIGPCEVPDGAVLFNGTEGDYYLPLFLSLSARDPDGDPISVQWHCKAGNQEVAITDLGDGTFSCNPYAPGESITVYAVVSDGVHEVTSEVRTYSMLARP